MKRVPKDIQRFASEPVEDIKKPLPHRSFLSVLWSQHWEIIIAAAAGLVVAGLLLLIR
jgi:hypothetical protein